LLLAGLAVGGIHLSFESTTRREQLRKGLGVASMVLGLLAFVRGLEVPAADGLVWREDLPAAMREARTAGRPLLVDFSASWCGACGELDRHTFSHPDVVREGQRFVTVRVDLSPGKDTPEKRQYLERYAPLVIIHDRRGREASRVTGFVEPGEFASLLRRVN
jgi:thiol:disulfide interchange protein DsbD